MTQQELEKALKNAKTPEEKEKILDSVGLNPLNKNPLMNNRSDLERPEILSPLPTYGLNSPLFEKEKKLKSLTPEQQAKYHKYENERFFFRNALIRNPLEQDFDVDW